MTLYDKIDLVADSYIPIIFMFAIYDVFTKIKGNETRQGIKHAWLLVLLIAWVYLVQSIDNYFLLWVFYSLDYSTHTAFSLAIVYFFFFRSFKIKLAMIISFVVYICLMIYQKYHTLADIISTIVILSPVMYFMVYYHSTLVFTKVLKEK